jgi:hypothetical protein
MKRSLLLEFHMAVTTPEWLAKHNGSIQECPDGNSWAVIFDNQPQYVLRPYPAGGRYSCDVMQSINGRHVGSGAIYDSADQALAGGLEDLRKILGW